MSTAPTLSTQELAQVLRVTPKTVRQWIREGMPVVKRGAGGRGRESRINLRQSFSWYLDQRAQQSELEVERTRLASAQADKLALQNAERRKQLGEPWIWRELVDEVFAEISRVVLELPARVAPELHGNVNQRKERLDRVVREILSRLATYQPSSARSPAATTRRETARMTIRSD